MLTTAILTMLSCAWPSPPCGWRRPDAPSASPPTPLSWLRASAPPRVRVGVRVRVRVRVRARVRVRLGLGSGLGSGLGLGLGAKAELVVRLRHAACQGDGLGEEGRLERLQVRVRATLKYTVHIYRLHEVGHVLLVTAVDISVGDARRVGGGDELHRLECARAW
eukprot:scaffold131496_cov45-Phaeocystis_antarctica.AAC.1